MKYKKIRNFLYLKNALAIMFISFLTISCDSNKDISADNDWSNVATTIKMDDIPMPELSEKETALVDSISKLYVTLI